MKPTLVLTAPWGCYRKAARVGLTFSQECRCRLVVVARTRRGPYDTIRARREVAADVTTTSLLQAPDLDTSLQCRTCLNHQLLNRMLTMKRSAPQKRPLYTTEGHNYYVSVPTPEVMYERSTSHLEREGTPSKSETIVRYPRIMNRGDFNARLLGRGASSADPEGDSGEIYGDEMKYLDRKRTGNGLTWTPDWNSRRSAIEFSVSGTSVSAAR